MIQEGSNTSVPTTEPTTPSSTTTEELSSLAQSLNALKTFNPKENYQVNSYVDALDSFSTWRIAKILQIKDDVAKVNFDGWSQKWDENIKLGGSKIAPFKKVTPIYTGGNKGAIRDFNFEDSRELIQKTIEQLNNLTAQKLKVTNPHFITQFFRGNLYILFDAIFSLPMQLKSSSDLKLINDLMEAYIQFFIEYIQVLPSLLKEYIDGKALNQPLLYQVNEKIALVSCIPELFDTMFKLFGGDYGETGRLKLYQNNDFPLKAYPAQVAKAREKFNASSSNQIVNCINYFTYLGGYDKLISLLKWEQKGAPETKAKSDSPEKDNVYRFPLNQIRSILLLIHPTVPLLSSTLKSKLGPDLKAAFFERLDKLTNRDFKDNDKQILWLIKESLPVFENFYGREAFAFCEQAELDVTLSLLKSPFLERKIKALNEFKDFFDRVDPNVDSKQLAGKRRFQYLTMDKLKNWIIQKKILEYVIGEQSHVELLKRSVTIMKFLANTNVLTQNILDLLWKGNNSTHEEYVRAVYDAVIELSAEVSLEHNDYLFTKIKEIPAENYNEMTIDMLMKFTLNGTKIAVASSPSSYFAKAIKKSSKYEFYGLRIVWDLFQDKSPMKIEFTSAAFQAFVTLIKNSNFKPEREKYLTLCFENVKKGVSVPQSLLLSLHILSTYNTQSGMFKSTSSLDEMSGKYQKEYNLIDTVTNDFDRYMKEVAEVAKALQESGNTPADKQAHVYVGRYSHIQNIEQRLLFLENIGLQLRKGDFSIEHLKILWNVLVRKSVTEVERNLFLKWILKSKTSNNGKTKTYIVNDQLMKSFFAEVLCDPQRTNNFKLFTPEIFACFEKSFEIINDRENNIELYRNSFKVVRFNNLIGHEVLWDILVNCTNEGVLRSVKSLLVTIHLKLVSDNNEDKLSVWRSFVQKWVETFQLVDKNANSDLLTNVISLLNLFIVKFDGRLYLQQDGPVDETVKLNVMDKKNDSLRRTITMPLNGTFFLLRKKISEEFGIPLNEFDMYLQPNSKITQDIEEDFSIASTGNDNNLEKDILINMKSVLSSSSNFKEKFKTYFINDQKIMDILFEYLAAKNSKIVNDIWELLNCLPVNKNLRNTFETLTVESGKEWFTILDLTCTRKFLYCLRIITDLAMNQGEENPWNVTFIKQKGFDHIFKLFFKIEENELSSVFKCKSQATLIKLINFFFENYLSTEKFEPEKISETFNKVLRGISLVTENDFITDANDPHLQEDLQKPAGEFVHNSFELLSTCIKQNPSLIKTVYEFPNLSKLIRNGLIESNDPDLRLDFSESLVKLIKLMNQSESPEGLPEANSFFLSFLLKDLLDYAMSHRDKCKEFFNTIESIFKQCREKDIEAAKIDFFDLANELSEKIISLPPFEAQQTDQDYLLRGLMNLLSLVFTQKPNIKDEILSKAQPNLLQNILHNCLFEIPSAVAEKGAITGPKCKNKESRKAALQLLQSMTTGTNQFTLETLRYFKKLLLHNFWRTKQNSDWCIVPVHAEKPKSGYVGLENLGCTCYMNSLMQQLYMISDFRDTMLESEDVNADKIENHENLFHQVQLIYGALKLSQRKYYDPRLFCHAFKDYDGNPMNVLEQMDVDEFFNNIMDKLENVIKHTKNEGIIKRVFGGVLSNELICKGCPHYSEREEPCLAISLQVKNKKNILESLQAFVQGEMLEGENAYLCERCDKKVNTLKRVCIKKLPNILILVLKRFEFDYDTMQRFKVNDYCEFPQNLNMQQFTQEYLKKENQKEKDEKGENNNEEETANAEVKEYPSEYYEYKLRGTVIHMGTAESGHYYSFIKDNNNAWFEFNDSTVKPFDPKDLAQEAFGGEEKLNIENIGNAKEIKERSRNAYLLFYEREAYFDENMNKVPTMLIGDQDREVRGRIENMNPQILKETKEDHFRFHATKYIWDKDYGEFVYKIMEQIAKRNDLANLSPDVLEMAKFCTLFFMVVILRAQERIRIPRFLKELKAIFRGSPHLSAWFIENFTYPDILKEFMVDCTVKDMKYFVFGLLKISMKNLYSESNTTYEEFEKSNLVNFINSVILTMYDQADQVKMLDKLFDILAVFSSLGVWAKKYLASKKMVGRLIFYMVPEKPPSQYKELTEEFKVNLPSDVSELGKPNYASESIVKSVSDMISKKKEKLIMEATQVNYNALIETISNIVEPESVNSKELLVDIEKDERTLLFSNIKVAQMLLMNATSKRARKIISSLLTYIAIGNEDFCKNYFNLLEAELIDKDDAQLKVYLQCLDKLMLVQDDLQKDRVEKGVAVFMNAFKENSKYYKATEISLDYLFKLCAKNSWALGVFSKKKTFLQYVESWLREYSNPYHGFVNGQIKLFKRKSYKVTKEDLLQYGSKFTSKSQERIAKLRKVFKNESDELASEYDSDEDYSDHQYQVHEKVDFLTDGKWISGVVADNLDEMIKISVGNNQIIWIHYDADRTGPHLKVQSHTKNNFEFYKS